MKRILFILLSITIHSGCAQKQSAELNVTELNTINFSRSQDSVLLDVRTLKEFEEGKIASSKNIDVTRTDEFTSQVKQLDKSKHYFIICRSGSRSTKAVQLMQDLGFDNLHHVAGGILAWEKENFALEK